jgi:hypothetical protein
MANEPDQPSAREFLMTDAWRRAALHEWFHAMAQATRGRAWNQFIGHPYRAMVAYEIFMPQPLAECGVPAMVSCVDG